MKLLLIRPSDHFSHTDELRDCAGHSIPLDRLPLFNVAALPVIVGDNGLPVKDVNGFLAHMAVRSRGATGDTARTYAEAVLSWLKFAQAQRFSLGNATEELLAQYRNEMVFICGVSAKGDFYLLLGNSWKSSGWKWVRGATDSTAIDPRTQCTSVRARDCRGCFLLRNCHDSSW